MINPGTDSPEIRHSDDKVKVVTCKTMIHQRVQSKNPHDASSDKRIFKR